MRSKWFRLLAVAAVAAVVAGVAPAKETPKPKAQPTKAAKTKPAAPKKLPKMLEIGSTKCIPCKAMMPIVDSLKKDYKGQIEIQFIDVTVDQKAAEKYKIKTIPTQIFYDANGKEFSRHTGFFPKEEIIKTFKDHGIKLQAPAKKEKK